MEEKNAKILVYRYIFKVKDGENEKDKLCVKYLSDVEKAHAEFKTALLHDSNVLSAMREYVCEVDCSYIGAVEHVKAEYHAPDNSDFKPDENLNIMEEDKNEAL